MSSVITLCLYEFRIQMKTKRVWLGYLVGMVLIINHSIGYVRYAASLGEPINVLEPFLVAANNPNTILFMILGWLLVISGVPFIDDISYYAVYRTNRKRWNNAVLLYICMQSVLYYIILIAATICIGLKNGYLANVWSYSIVKLASGIMANEYDASFPYQSFIKAESLYMAFFQTFLLSVLYAIWIGVLTYLFSLALRHRTGAVFGIVVHFLGYEIMKEGFGFKITYSLLARSIPALQVGKGALTGLRNSCLLFLIFTCILMILSHKIICCIDFQRFSNQESGD